MAMASDNLHFFYVTAPIIPRYRKAVVPSTHTAENHDIISSDQGEQIINLKVLVPLRTLRQYAEQMKQIVIQPQAVGFCRFHQRIDDCTRLRTLGCIGKEPSLPANDKRADGVFNLVVADFNLTMLKKRAEVRWKDC